MAAFRIILLCLGSALFLNSYAQDETLDKRLDDVRLEHNIVRTSYFVVDRHELRADGTLGHTHVDRARPAAFDDLIRVGSITKTFTALLTQRLAQRGTVHLDAPLENALDSPPYDNPWAPDTPVTLARLLEHTAGLTDLSAKEFGFNEPVSLETAFAVDPSSRTLRWRPGLHSSYSNSGAGIVAYALEKATGESFESLMQREVFAPLKLTSASLQHSAELEAMLVGGYDHDGRSPIPYWHTLYRAFGALNIRAPDLARVIRMLLSQGQLDGTEFLPRASIERMQRPETTLAAAAGLKYGYGLGMYAVNHGGHLFFGHGGDADGHLAHFEYSPALGLGYFISVNAFNKTALNAMKDILRDHCIALAGVARPAPVTVSEPVDLNRYIGTYREVTARFPTGGTTQIQVEMRDGELRTVTAAGIKRALIPAGNGFFRRKHQTVATYAFVRHQGQLFLQGDLGNFAKID